MVKSILKKGYLIFKNIIFCGVFFAFLVYILSFFAPLFRYEEDANSTGTLSLFYAEDKNSVDVVCIGSSSTYRFMAPTVMYKEYGITMLNFATAAMQGECVSGVVDEVLEYQKPKVLIIDVRNYVRNTESRLSDEPLSEKEISKKESYISRLVNNMPVSVNRAKIVHDSVPTLLQQEEIYWQFEYLRTHNNWKNLKAEDVKEYIFDQLSSEKEIKNLNGEYKGLNYKGTITTSKVSNIKVTDYSNYKEKAEITGEWLDVMQELIDKAKSLDINVLFLSAPYSADKLQTAYLNTLTELFDEEGVDFLNCNNFYDEIGIDFTSDFYDDRHANLLGLEKTTKFVGAYLKEKYGLEKSDLTESQAQEWQKAADLWYDEVFYPGSEKIMNYVAKQKAKGNTNY